MVKQSQISKLLLIRDNNTAVIEFYLKAIAIGLDEITHKYILELKKIRTNFSKEIHQEILNYFDENLSDYCLKNKSKCYWINSNYFKNNLQIDDFINENANIESKARNDFREVLQGDLVAFGNMRDILNKNIHQINRVTEKYTAILKF